MESPASSKYLDALQQTAEPRDSLPPASSKYLDALQQTAEQRDSLSPVPSTYLDELQQVPTVSRIQPQPKMRSFSKQNSDTTRSIDSPGASSCVGSVGSTVSTNIDLECDDQPSMADKLLAREMIGVPGKGPLPTRKKQEYEEALGKIMKDRQAEKIAKESYTILQHVLRHPRMVELRAMVRRDRLAAQALLETLPEVDPSLAAALAEHHDALVNYLIAEPEALDGKGKQDPLAALIGSFHRARDREMEHSFLSLCSAYHETMPNVLAVMGSLKRKADAHTTAVINITDSVKKLARQCPPQTP